MYCSKCGKSNPNDAKFCNACGASLHSASAPDRNSAAAPKTSQKTSAWGSILLIMGGLYLLGGFANGSFEEMMAYGLAFPDIVSLGLGALCLIFGIKISFHMDSESILWMGLVAAGIIAFMFVKGGKMEESSPGMNLALDTPVLTQPAVTYEQPVVQTENPYAGFIPSDWASETRYLGDGGSCGIMEMDSPVRNCNAVDFTLSAEGNYGATTRGNWEVHFRIGGQWKKITSVYYGGSGEETFRVRFDAPTTFDAVSAFPTQRGNYSYSSLYYLSNADCS